MQAKDIMTPDVLFVTPEVDTGRIAQLLLEHRISGVPVVDEGGRVLGIVSEGDLIRRAECDRGRSWWLSLFADPTLNFTRAYGTRARDLMSRNVVSVEEDAPLATIARLLEAHGIKRLPVIRDGTLIGIVSRADVLRGMAVVDSALDANAVGSDNELRYRILNLLKKRTAASLPSVSVIVVNGTVFLWGIAETEADKQAIRIAAENIGGVKQVHDFLSTPGGVLRGI